MLYYKGSDLTMKKLWQKSEYKLNPAVEAFETKGDLLMEDDQTLEAVFSSWPKEKPVMVHTE